VVTNLKELTQAFKERCQSMNLEYECGMDGTFFSQVAIVAEAPGPVEVGQKLPLVGGSGALLWRQLKKHCNMTRKDVYITNVSKRQVMYSDVRRKAIDHHELSLWQQLLHWELGHLPHLRVILCMGNYALEALTGKMGITNWRGSVLSISMADHSTGASRSIKVVCTNNPAAVLREPRLEIVYSFDVARLKRVIDGQHSPTTITTEMYPTVERVAAYCKDARRDKNMIAVDIETVSNETACIGFARHTTQAFCIAFRDKSSNVYTMKEEIAIRRSIAKLLSSPTPKFVAQNGMFDMTWLWYKDKIRVPSIYFDTMLAHHVLYPTLPHNLGFLTSQYTDNPYYKDERSSWRDGEDIESFWDYNGKDCCNTLAVAFRLLHELRTQDMDAFFFDHVMRLQRHLALMTVGGILIDMDLKERLRDGILSNVNDLLHKFQRQCMEATGDNTVYNPNSPKQLSDLFFNKLKLVGRGASTDAENRERMFKHPRTPEPARQIIATLNDYSREHKFYSTYVKSAVDDDNRMRCTWNQTGVQEAPGRLSSSQTLWGSGANLQNQPSRAYPMFIADPGYGFGYFDLSQAEARYVGWAAGIESWIEQFEKARVDRSYDAHRALASTLFHVPYDEVPTHDRYDTAKGDRLPEGKVNGDVTIRFIAKRCRHGLNYRMMPDKLATTTGLSLREAEYAYRLYHRETPELRAWWASLERDLSKNGSLFNAYGRRYILLERKTPEALESMVAFKPQSSIGDKVSRVIYQCHEDDRWPSHCRIVLNNHDALIALGRLDQIQTALSIMKHHAEEPMYVNNRELVIPADTKLSYPDEDGVHRWSQLKEVVLQ
jgi:uracil-DNA glycosylase family 4